VNILHYFLYIARYKTIYNTVRSLHNEILCSETSTKEFLLHRKAKEIQIASLCEISRIRRNTRTSSSRRFLSSCSSSSSNLCAFNCMLSEPWNRLRPGPVSMPRCRLTLTHEQRLAQLRDASIMRSIFLFITP